MQGGRGGRDDFFNFGDPFGGGFGDQRSLVSNLFGGRDPFDDPFFNRPFGSGMLGSGMLGSGMLGSGMLGSGMLGSNMFGPSMFGSSMFGPNSSPFGNQPPVGQINNQPSQGNNSRAVVIEEINSDDETDEQEKSAEERRENPRKHSRSNTEPYVEDPDDIAEERRIRPMQQRSDLNRAWRNPSNQPQTRSFSFQSSTVTYGGANGAYYTSSTTRKSGDDGVVVEESKEADTTTGKAKHRLSRGIREKGHTLTRKLNPDGKVETMQTLHNLDEDELPVFEEAWKGDAAKKLPGWSEGNSAYGDMAAGSSRQHDQASSGRRALPPAEQLHNSDPKGRHQAKPYHGRV